MLVLVADLQQVGDSGREDRAQHRGPLARWRRCRVNVDYRVLVERHDYSVPFQLLRE